MGVRPIIRTLRHGLRERAHRLDFIGRTLGWFEKYLSTPKVEAIKDRKD